MPNTDYAIICGLSTDGEPDDWLHLGIPVQEDDIWELQFRCCHKLGAPDAIVVGSFVMFDADGNYVATTDGPIYPSPTWPATDGTAWTFFSFPYQFTDRLYVFPAIWWHATAELRGRYLCGVQMAQIQSTGGTIAVLQPDVFLTLGVTDKKLASSKSKLGSGV
jgi:hypothetical protein